MVTIRGPLLGRLGSLARGWGGLPRAGLVAAWVPVTVNLLRYPQDFTASDWPKANMTLTPGQPDPCGGVTATRAAHAIGTGLYQNLTYLRVGETYTFSFWAKNNGGANAKYLVWDNTHAANIVSLTSYVETLADGQWHRISVPFTVPVDCLNVGVYPLFQSANCDLFLWGAQVNSGATVLPYDPNSYSPTLQSFAPRWGTAYALQRGSAVGADPYDPAVSLSGLVFDGVYSYCVPGAGPASAEQTQIVVFQTSAAITTYQALLSGAPANGHTYFGPHYIAAQVLFGSAFYGSQKTIQLNGIVEGRWHYGVYRRAIDSFRICLDGTWHTGLTGIGTPAAVFPTIVGAYSQTGPYFPGTIAAVLIYNRALSDAEVEAARVFLRRYLAAATYGAVILP